MKPLSHLRHFLLTLALAAAPLAACDDPFPEEHRHRLRWHRRPQAPADGRRRDETGNRGEDGHAHEGRDRYSDGAAGGGDHHQHVQEDERDYGVGAGMLHALGIRKIRLITNNPVKKAGLEGYGMTIVETIPLEITSNPHNQFYLETKRDKMGHFLNIATYNHHLKND